MAITEDVKAGMILAGLTAKQILYMSDYLDGVSLTNIADRNGVSLSSVSRTVKAAKIKLSRLYGSASVIPDREV